MVRTELNATIFCSICKLPFDTETRLRIHLRGVHKINDKVQIHQAIRRSRRTSGFENSAAKGTRIDGPIFFRKTFRAGKSSLSITIPIEVVEFLKISHGDNLIVSLISRNEFRVRIIEKELLPLVAKTEPAEVAS